MKTDRRHQLERNQLADALARWVEAAKPYSRAITALLIGIVVLLFGWGYLATLNHRTAAAGWNEYFAALSNPMGPRTRDDLSSVVDRFPGTTVSEWALLELADRQLLDGTNQIFGDRATSRDQLKQSIDKYRVVFEDARDPMLKQRALWGLARARETLGSLEEARKDYRTLVERWPDSPYAATAKTRAADLEQQGTKQFYDWLAKYEPPRGILGEPGTPGSRRDFLQEAVDDSILKFPSSIGGGLAPPKLNLPGGDTSSSDEPAGSPAGDNKPPVADEPAQPSTPPPADPQE